MELARRFADDAMLPLNHTHFAEAIIKIYIEDVENAIENDAKMEEKDIGPVKEQMNYLRVKAHVILIFI